MKKLATILPLAAAAALAGCATEPDPQPMAPVYSSTGTPVHSGAGAAVVSAAPAYSPARAGTVQPIALRPGTGLVETVAAVPFVGSASTGSTVAGGASRLGIRMSDGTIQYVDYENRDIAVGSRVELTPEGYIRKL